MRVAPRNQIVVATAARVFDYQQGEEMDQELPMILASSTAASQLYREELGSYWYGVAATNDSMVHMSSFPLFLFFNLFFFFFFSFGG